MLSNAEQLVLNVDSKDMLERKLEDSPSVFVSNSPTRNSRPSSMVVKKVNAIIPAHLIAEAISTIHGLDLRWSGPITQSEMQYVRQYVFAKYPQYCNGIVVDGDNTIDLTNLCINEESSRTTPDSKPGYPKRLGAGGPTPFIRSPSDIDETQLEASRLLDVLNKKTTFQGNFISVPEIQAQNRALKHCGLSETDYLVIFMPNYRGGMGMIGESYPFFRGNHYMAMIGEENDMIREFATCKESKVIPIPETWLNLRIKGSQLSQFFRRKCKHIPKGLFSYPAIANETIYSTHWISEAHRNSCMFSLMPQAWFLEKTGWPLHSTGLTSCCVHSIIHTPRHRKSPASWLGKCHLIPLHLWPRFFRIASDQYDGVNKEPFYGCFPRKKSKHALA